MLEPESTVLLLDDVNAMVTLEVIEAIGDEIFLGHVVCGLKQRLKPGADHCCFGA